MREEESEMFNGAFVVRSSPGKDKSQKSFLDQMSQKSFLDQMSH
jgi:hypothetical protein